MYVSIPDCFIISLFVGIVFGLVYEALRIVRLLLPFKVSVFLCDVAFFVISTKVIMTLSEIMGSYVRIYTVLGFGCGVFSYIVTVGRLFNVAENAAANAWRKAIGNAVKSCSKTILGLVGSISHKYKSLFGKIAEYRRRNSEKSTLYLKSADEMMYNKKRLEKIGGRTGAIVASVRRNI